MRWSFFRCCSRTDGREVAGMTNVLASFDPDLIMQCARLLAPFALLEWRTCRRGDYESGIRAANSGAPANHRDPDARACESGDVLPGDQPFVSGS